MAGPGRQIEGVSAATLVADLARVAIEQRLGTVLVSFPLAAKSGATDHESIHQLRVAARRAVAAVQLFRRFYPRRRTARLLRDLKRIRRTAGNARDLDVFTARLTTSSGPPHQRLVQLLSAERMEAQQEIADLFIRLAANDRLLLKAQAVFERVKPRGKKSGRIGQQSVAQWAPRRLQKAQLQFLEAVPSALQEFKQLHSLRVAGKRLRYTLELLAAGLPPDVYDAAYQQLEELQDRLGAINDHAVAIEWLDSHAAAEKQVVERVIAIERLAMQQSIEQTDSWFRESLLPQFRELSSPRNEQSPSIDPRTSAYSHEVN